MSPKFKLAAGCERRVGFSCRSSFGQPDRQKNFPVLLAVVSYELQPGGFQDPEAPSRGCKTVGLGCHSQSLVQYPHVPLSYCNNFL